MQENDGALRRGITRAEIAQMQPPAGDGHEYPGWWMAAESPGNSKVGPDRKDGDNGKREQKDCLQVLLGVFNGPSAWCMV